MSKTNVSPSLFLSIGLSVSQLTLVFLFSIVQVFDCTGAIKVQDLNRVQWENQNSGKVSVCVKDVRLIPQDEAAVASAGRR
jgi:hypothetical protein